MAEPWYSHIAKDLEDVESIMMDTIASDSAELTEMCEYVLGSHGKRIRPSICLLSFYACGGKDPKDAKNLGAALEIIHNATLIHDDINDQGDLRRGHKALYKEYSLSKSIVAGDYLFALGFHLAGTSAHEIVNFVVEAAAHMGAGEFDQKDYEHNTNVSENEYMKIIEGKTAKLLEAASKIGSFLACTDAEHIAAFGSFSHDVGMAFQIVDDVLDVAGDKKATGKNIGTDIIEGKPTLPIIYGMADPVHGQKIREIFESSNASWAEVAIAIDLIKKTDSLPICMEKAKELVNNAVHYLDNIPDSIYKDDIINMAYFIVNRDR